MLELIDSLLIREYGTTNTYSPPFDTALRHFHPPVIPASNHTKIQPDDLVFNILLGVSNVRFQGSFRKSFFNAELFHGDG
jgi:hypothetical protein